MKPNAIKLLAIDLDGTLLNSRHQVSQRNKAALLRAMDQGIAVVIATGKTRGAAAAVIDELGIQSPGVFMQGLITSEADGSVRRRIVMDSAIASHVIALAYGHGFGALVYSGDRAFARELNAESLALTAYGEPPPEARPDLSELPFDIEINKIILYGEEAHVPAMRKALIRALDESIHITRAAVPGMLETLPADASKGRAVAELMREMGVAPEQAMAFGDGENDIEMLEAVGVGVAMGNAAEALKEVADVIAPDNDADGVAQMIERYALGAM